ncbi:MAG TPA: alpha/beta hydrolase-fold protein [Bryobacteraceae bacterium]
MALPPVSSARGRGAVCRRNSDRRCRGGYLRGATARPRPSSASINPAGLRRIHGLEIVRKEFNVDPNRTYLMGHSMGGAGTLFLGSKHASEWAAITAVAPAAFLMNDKRAEILGGIKEPVVITQGDADMQVPVTNTRIWVETIRNSNRITSTRNFPGLPTGA